MNVNWVVAGGKVREIGHCTRCGDGLEMGMPQRIEVVTAAMNAFVRAHRSCKLGQFTEPPVSVNSWPASRDTGVSSATIYYVFTGRKVYDNFDVPHDPDDFGRCYRLLKLAPTMEAVLFRVSDMFPTWKPFVREWAKLKAIYEEAVKTKDATVFDRGKEMYDFIQTLRTEKPEAS